MKDSPDSPRPRRRWGVLLLGLAACSLYYSGAATAGGGEASRDAILFLGGLAFLLVYAALTPAALSYSLMFDLRLRDRQRLEQAGSGGRMWARLWAKARAVDLVVPFCGTLVLFAAAWCLIEAAAGFGPIATVAAAVVLALVAVPLGNLLPTRLAGRSPDGAARLSGNVIEGAVSLLAPLLGAAAWTVDRLVHDGIDDEDEGAAEADLADVIEVGSHQGDLSIAQSELLRREMDFATKVAADVMVPRVEVNYLDLSMTFDQAKEHVAAARYSRFPVKNDSVDNVVAVLHAKTLLKHLQGEKPDSLRKLLALEVPRKPLEVPEQMPLEDVLEALQRTKSSLAVVKDGYGGVAGILTVEDVVEELVGEIVDESDREAVVETLQISGRRQLAELVEHGVVLDGEPEASLAEYLAERLGDEPAAGQSLAAAGWRITVDVLDADGEIETVTAERILPASGQVA